MNTHCKRRFLMVAGHQRDRNGIWYTVVSYYDKDKKRKTVMKSTGLAVKGNKKRAEEALYLSRLEIQKQLDLEASGGIEKKTMVGFTEFLQTWLNMMKKSVEPTTFSSYQISLNNKIIPYFDSRFPGILLTDITP